MRILFILPSLNVGGLEREQVTLANALVKRGYDVTVMTLSEGDELRADLLREVKFVYKPPKQHLGKKIPYIRNKFYDDGMWETRASARKLHEYYIGNEHYDVEIGFFRGLPIKIVSGAASVKNSTTISKKSVCTHTPEENHTDFEKEIVVRRLAWVHTDFEKATGYRNQFKNLEAVFKAYKNLDSVICVSNQAKEGFKKAIGDTGNLATIYNLLPTEEIQRKAKLKPEIKVKKEKFHIVLVGRLLDSAKGQKRLIGVVSKLHNEGFSVSLALVGGGGDEKMLRDEINNNDAEDYITMTGNQKNPYPYIKDADLLVCASYFEGFNLTVAEALILGTPVLSTECAGPTEILDNGKYGMIVENSEKGVYNGIQTFLNDPSLLEEYRKKAAQRLNFFDEDRILKQITDLFERCI